MQIKLDFSRLQLSDREVQILLLAAEGKSDKEITQELGLSAGTVRTYWERTRQKLQSRSRSEAIAKTLKEIYANALDDYIASRLWLDILIENLETIAIFNLDPSGKLMSWNIGVHRLFGYEENEFVGQPFSLIFTPEDVQIGAHEQEMQVARDRGKSTDNRFHLRKDGTRIWAVGTLVAIKHDGLVVGYAKLIQDATALKQATDETHRLAERLVQAETND